ncbi:hypothetical protein GFS60_06774 (plasmid) [Rhodococcus sp. WAY2]|nr:hypothetical protein GFS60_06774 [Rhodococcus sp. WAY2]
MPAVRQPSYLISAAQDPLDSPSGGAARVANIGAISPPPVGTAHPLIVRPDEAYPW